METVPGRGELGNEEMPAPVAGGRRRRPSGEPPPLPRHLDWSTWWLVLFGAAAALLWLGLWLRPSSRVITAIDLTGVRAIGRQRFRSGTTVLSQLNSVASAWAVPVTGWATIVTLVAFRRLRRLALYLAVLLAVSVLSSTVALAVGRMRPAGVVITGHWSGYSQPSRPTVGLSLVVVGVLYTLLPGGRARHRGAWIGAIILGLFCFGRLYLGVDHPTDVVAALALGGAVPVALFRLAIPDDILPITYGRRQPAHLDTGGPRGEAIVKALDQQLGLRVVSAEPFGREASAGSTPLLLHVCEAGSEQDVMLFAKLYAVSHLRSDRWYKLVRTVLYGRLEDEKPFSTVRRLVEYEDHLLRLLRDDGLPTPAPHGFVEITPEREYLIVMEFFAGARELGSEPIDDRTIDDGLAVVRQLWNVGVAHRDIKPSNVLVRDGRVLLIDVAFGAVRPSPWRQAVDLANMMLSLALASSAERVYERAVLVFAPEEIAEAFAASRSITVPNQLRTRMAADGRDLLGQFRSLAPDRPPVAIQLWTVRRVALTVALAGALAAAAVLVVAYVNVVGLR